MSAARRFAIALASGFLAATAGWGALLALQSGVFSHEFAGNHAVFNFKEAAARRVAGPRMLLVAGSSVFFGLNARMMHEALAVPVVNLGVSGGFGLDYLLDRAERVLRRGDLVYLPLEYPLYDDTGVPNFMLSHFVLTCDRRYLLRATPDVSLGILFGLPPERLFEGVSWRFQPSTDGVRAEALARLDDLGDQAKLDAPSPEALAAWRATWAPKEVMRHAEVSAYASKRLAAFAETCRREGVELVVGYCPMMDFPVYHQSDGLTFLGAVSSFWTRRGVAVVGQGEAFIYPPSDFYDTVFHLNTAAQQRHTRMMIAQLSPLPHLVRLRQRIAAAGTTPAPSAPRSSSARPSGGDAPLAAARE